MNMRIESSKKSVLFKAATLLAFAAAFLPPACKAQQKEFK
jgi:hypothetical protein